MSIDFNKITKLKYGRYEQDSSDIAELLQFDSRETYLAWVSAWKVFLKETIVKIRQAKVERSNPKNNEWEKNGANAERQALRVVACNLMSLRAAGKQKSKESKKALVLA